MSGPGAIWRTACVVRLVKKEAPAAESEDLLAVKKLVPIYSTGNGMEKQLGASLCHFCAVGLPGTHVMNWCLSFFLAGLGNSGNPTSRP